MAIPGSSGASPWGYGSEYNTQYPEEGVKRYENYDTNGEINPWVDETTTVDESNAMFTHTGTEDGGENTDQIKINNRIAAQRQWLDNVKSTNAWKVFVTNRENKAGQKPGDHTQNGLSYDIMDRIEALLLAGLIYDRNDRTGVDEKTGKECKDNSFHTIDKRELAKELEKIHKEHKYSTNWGKMEAGKSNFTYTYQDMVDLVHAAGYEFKDENVDNEETAAAQPKEKEEVDPDPEVPQVPKDEGAEPVPEMETVVQDDEGEDIRLTFDTVTITDDQGNTRVEYQNIKFYNNETGKWETYTGDVEALLSQLNPEEVEEEVIDEVPEDDNTVVEEENGEDPLIAVNFTTDTVTDETGRSASVTDAEIINLDNGAVDEYHEEVTTNVTNATNAPEVGTDSEIINNTIDVPKSETSPEDVKAKIDERMQTDSDFANLETFRQVHQLQDEARNIYRELCHIRNDYNRGYRVEENKRLLGFIGPKTKNVAYTDQEKAEMENKYRELAAKRLELLQEEAYLEFQDKNRDNSMGNTYTIVSVDNETKLSKDNSTEKGEEKTLTVPRAMIQNMEPLDGGEAQKVFEVIDQERNDQSSYNVRYYKPKVIYGKDRAGEAKFVVVPDMDNEVTSNFEKKTVKYRF